MVKTILVQNEPENDRIIYPGCGKFETEEDNHHPNFFSYFFIIENYYGSASETKSIDNDEKDSIK